MSKEVQTAQKIYIEHECNYKLMKDDDSIKEYETFNVSKELEAKWQDLYKDELIRNLHMNSDDKKSLYAKKLADITSRTNDYDSLIALFNETKKMYKINDVNNVVSMCQIIPSAISPAMLTSNYIKVREIIIDVMDMLEVLLRKNITEDKGNKKEIRTSLDIKDIKNTILKEK